LKKWLFCSNFFSFDIWSVQLMVRSDVSITLPKHARYPFHHHLYITGKFVAVPDFVYIIEVGANATLLTQK